jgi:hypothetical protein
MSKWFRFGSLASRLSRVGQDRRRRAVRQTAAGGPGDERLGRSQMRPVVCDCVIRTQPALETTRDSQRAYVDRATLQGATLGYDVTWGDTVFKTSIELAAHYAIPRTNVVAGVRFQQ